MVKQISILFISLLLCSNAVWAQRAAQEDDRAARKQWEEDQRADEYANSLRRRDWLKDRLILEMGMGTKFPVMGANWFGFGAGVEYITKWHASAFLTGGFILSHDDPVEFEPKYTLDGDMGWRFGFAYYLFPKNPIHLSFQVSYGTVFYDHQAKPADESTLLRPILLCKGYEFDAAVSYLSDQWYFLQAIIGVYTIGNGIKANGARGDPSDPYKGSYDSWGRSNPSWEWKLKEGYVSRITVDKADEAIPPVGVVFGLGIGFAFEEFFPDDTEIRRRERESGKSKQNQFRKKQSSSYRD
ncbi:hypothetical protein R83H12_02110 [Fibrobacteria bacterium R8-3-H12]